MSENERRFSMELEIEATAADVWRALTEAEELMRWFPPHAEVEPGESGRIHLSWGEGLTGDNPVRIWEPERRLQTGWWEAHGESAPARTVLAVDFFIESRGRHTRLRLVHSGFGTDESWDTEYDSISRGWNFELRSLRHYLEHFRGRDRRIAQTRIPIAGHPPEVWNRIVGPGRLFAAEAGRLEEGQVFELTLPDGERSQATLLYQRVGTDFSAILRVLDGGVLRLGLESFSGEPELWLWLASWSLSQAALDRRLADWRARIEAVAAAA